VRRADAFHEGVAGREGLRPGLHRPGQTGNAAYVEELYDRMTPNGVVLVENTLRSGQVPDPQTEDDRALVPALVRDRRRGTELRPAAAGLTVPRKR
jgi:caffeoyl-CoA O-methyltransferase